jgi:hypothetical protein
MKLPFQHDDRALRNVGAAAIGMGVAAKKSWANPGRPMQCELSRVSRVNWAPEKFFLLQGNHIH